MSPEGFSAKRSAPNSKSAEIIELAPYRRLSQAIENAQKIKEQLQHKIKDIRRAREASGEPPEIIEATMGDEDALLRMLDESRTKAESGYAALKKRPQEHEAREEAREAYRELHDVLQESLQKLRDMPPGAVNDNKPSRGKGIV